MSLTLKKNTILNFYYKHIAEIPTTKGTNSYTQTFESRELRLFGSCRNPLLIDVDKLSDTRKDWTWIGYGIAFKIKVLIALAEQGFYWLSIIIHDTM